MESIRNNVLLGVKLIFGVMYQIAIVNIILMFSFLKNYQNVHKHKNI